MLTRNQLLICNTSLYGLSVGAPTREAFHNWPGHLITFQAEGRLSWAAILGNSYGDKLFAFYFNATSTYSIPPTPFLSPLCSKEAILSSSICQRSFCVGLQQKINHDIQHFIVSTHSYAHTENMKGTLGHFRWPTVGPTMESTFHLVYVQRLFCETWKNFLSQLQGKAPGFVLSFCPTEDSASPVSYPVCA